MFQNAVLGDNLRSVVQILENLKNTIYKIYFHFLAYILEIINKLTIEFQSEHCKIFNLGTKIKSLYKSVLKNFLKREYIENTPLDNIDPKNPRNFLDIEEMYFGANVQILLETASIEKTEVHNFRLRSLEFYIELSAQIKMRFSFNDPVWSFCSLFTPENALSGKTNTIVKSVLFFPQLVTNVQELDSEWRLLPECEDLQQFKDLEFEKFWITVFKMKNNTDNPMFPNLSNFVKGLMCLPHSSAAAERQFSQYNLIKTKTRNRLLIETSDAILHSKNLLKGDTCFSWTPSNRLLQRQAKYRQTNTAT